MVPAALFIAAWLLGAFQNSAKAKGEVDVVSKAARGLAKPVAWPITAVTNWTGDFFAGIFGGAGLRRQVLSLKADAARLYHLESETARLQADANRLRGLLRMPDVQGRKQVVSDVVGYFAEDQRLALNVGKNQGVRRGDPVIAPQGLVGQVVEVSTASCLVNLLTSPNCSVGARVLRKDSQAIGTVRGTGERTLLLEVFYDDADVAANDILVTSGLSEVYPPGLRIGRVEKVWIDKDFGLRKGTIVPFFDVSRLREAIVLAQ
jgi:rod shape-determining protein MreC